MLHLCMRASVSNLKKLPPGQWKRNSPNISWVKLNNVNKCALHNITSFSDILAKMEINIYSICLG